MTEILSTARGDRIAYDRYGSGPGVVFIAGAGPTRASDPVTTETARRLADAGATTVVFDRTGRGESAAEGVLDLDRELDTVAAAIEVAGGSAVLVGHSSGCALALAAVDRGLPVTGLVLWEAPIAGDPERAREWTTGFEERLDRGDLEDAQVWYMRDMPAEWLERARSAPFWPQLYGQSPSLRADARALQWATSTDPASTFSRIRVPVLAIAGTESFDGMLAANELLESAIPGAVAERLEGADHSWDPQAMAARLHRFITTPHHEGDPS